MAEGVRVGLKNIYFAPITEETETSVTYAKPVKIGNAIEASISPSTNSETLYADDGPSEVETAQGATEVEIGTDQLSTKSQALLLGHKINADGVLEKRDTDKAPYGALLFESATTGGKSKLYALYKGKFMPQEESFATKTDSPEFQTDSISGTFVRREHDNLWQRSVFTGDDGVKPEVIANWFKAVYEPSTGSAEEVSLSKSSAVSGSKTS
ncbi:major tail protein [Bacillus amyloliquefaciens]|uniref:major tail protein n=1 Tax=Bacillus amyloliquefaciens TaxID=1390 RepID=UPI002DBE402D|nr:major tail protein [Bacillus amyloliquefaciens]MEC3841570.1 phage tail protein [Bacillus amyloliquefaciens]